MIVRTVVLHGRAVAQAISRRLPTATARVLARVKTFGFCVGQIGTGAGFLRVLRFSLPSIPLISPHSSSSIIIRGWYNMPVEASVIADSVAIHYKKEKRSRQSYKNKMAGI
jgi:hypothetical protein